MKAKAKAKNKKILVVGASLLTLTAGIFIVSKAMAKKQASAGSANAASIPEAVEGLEQAKPKRSATPPGTGGEIRSDMSIGELIQETMRGAGDSRLLVIGDSQVKRTLANAITADWGTRLGAAVTAWNKEGTTPAKLLELMGSGSSEGTELKALLKQQFPVIFIQLGDNGINGSAEVRSFLAKIAKGYSNSASKPLVIWSGPFPICLPNGQGTSYVKAPPCTGWKCLPNYQEMKRVDIPNKIRAGIASSEIPSTLFISPYDAPAFEGYESLPCFTIDGIHITDTMAQGYIGSLFDMRVGNAV